MRIKDILNEDATDIVARFYKEASKKNDRYYNPEDVKYKNNNGEYYTEYFKEWFDNETVPVFTKPVTKAQPEYTVTPKDGKLQSPGYRGLQYALAAAGLPYNHDVQLYKADPSRIIAAKSIDGARKQ